MENLIGIVIFILIGLAVSVIKKMAEGKPAQKGRESNFMPDVFKDFEKVFGDESTPSKAATSRQQASKFRQTASAASGAVLAGGVARASKNREKKQSFANPVDAQNQFARDLSSRGNNNDRDTNIANSDSDIFSALESGHFDLKSHNLRSAIIAYEILSKPKALRQEDRFFD